MSKSVFTKFIPCTSNAILAELGLRYDALNNVYQRAAEACGQCRQTGSEIQGLRQAIAQEEANPKPPHESRLASNTHSLEFKVREEAGLLLTQAALKASLYDALFQLLASMTKVNDWLLGLSNIPGMQKNPERHIGIVNLGACVDLCGRVMETCSKFGTLEGVSFNFLDDMLKRHSGWLKKDRPYRFTATIVSQVDNCSRRDSNPPADQAHLFQTWVLRIDGLLDPVDTPYPVGDEIGFAKSIFPALSCVGHKVLVTWTGSKFEGVRID